MLHLAVQYASEADVSAPAPDRARVRRWIRATLASEDVQDATLTLRFVDEAEGRALHRDFRGKDHATNVLTFVLDDESSDHHEVVADIVVCLPVVAREAADQRKGFDDHCAHLVVHGTLHACGHDHADKSEAEAMEARERRVLARFRIADPYRDDGHRVAD